MADAVVLYFYSTQVQIWGVSSNKQGSRHETWGLDLQLPRYDVLACHLTRVWFLIVPVSGNRVR